MGKDARPHICWLADRLSKVYTANSKQQSQVKSLPTLYNWSTRALSAARVGRESMRALHLCMHSSSLIHQYSQVLTLRQARVLPVVHVQGPL
jgi:hypothetical protein